MTQKTVFRKVFNYQFHSGQVAVIILLVSVVGLTLVLTVASQTISGLKRTEEIAESNRAFAAAEAGIEEAMLYLETTGPTPILTPVQKPLDTETTYSYTVTVAGGIGDQLAFTDYPLDQDEILQVDLSGTGGGVTVYWGKAVDPPLGHDQQASLVLTFVSEDGTGGYLMEKYAYNPSSASGRSNGFTDSGVCPPGSCKIGDTYFTYKTPAAITIPGQDQRILRIRALYNSTLATIVGVETSGGYNLPPQYETIVSLGQTGDVQRAVKATRSKPYLPAIFDYVLFSGSSTESLTK